MNDALIFRIALLVTIISVVGLGWVLRSVWREMNGLGNGEDAKARRTEQRKNEKIRKEIERWREGK